MNTCMELHNIFYGRQIFVISLLLKVPTESDCEAACFVNVMFIGLGLAGFLDLLSVV